MPKWGPFEGELAAPIVYGGDRPTGIVQTEDQEEFFAAENDRRMDLLFDRYDIERGDYEALCYSMAWDLVPGFEWQFKGDKDRGGRPRIWTEQDRIRVYQAVMRIRRESSKCSKPAKLVNKKIFELLATSGEFPPPPGVRLDDHIKSIGNVYNKFPKGPEEPTKRGRKRKLSE